MVCRRRNCRVRGRRRQRVRDRRLQRRDGPGADIRDRVEERRWIALERCALRGGTDFGSGQAVDDPAEGRADLRIGRTRRARCRRPSAPRAPRRERRADAHAAAVLDPGHLLDLRGWPGWRSRDAARGRVAQLRLPARRPTSSRSLSNGRRIALDDARARQDRPDIRSRRLGGGQVASAASQRPARRWRAGAASGRARRAGRLAACAAFQRPPDCVGPEREQRRGFQPGVSFTSVRSAALSATTSVAQQHARPRDVCNSSVVGLELSLMPSR